MQVGIVSPGSMGAAVGACVAAGGATPLWASEGRSEASRRRAGESDLEDVGDLRSLCGRADVVLSICPPHTAEAVAAHGFAGVYVDANAVAPATAHVIAGIVGDRATFVDGGIIGPPPRQRDQTRLYLAGDAATRIAPLFVDGPLTAVVLDGDVPAASALKMAYAAWTKGSSALLLAVRAYAAAEDVEDELVGEWARSQPGLQDRSAATATNVSPKAWRWVAEMHEIADAFAAVELPDGFHLGAADVYERLSGGKDRDGADVADVIAALLAER